MLKKKEFDYTAGVAALRRGCKQALYFEQIATDLHKFMNYSGYRPKKVLLRFEKTDTAKSQCGFLKSSSQTRNNSERQRTVTPEADLNS